jgi:hypothetical protein
MKEVAEKIISWTLPRWKIGFHLALQACRSVQVCIMGERRFWVQRVRVSLLQRMTKQSELSGSPRKSFLVTSWRRSTRIADIFGIISILFLRFLWTTTPIEHRTDCLPDSMSLFSKLLKELILNLISHSHCKIWGFRGGDYEEWRLLGCYAVWLL